VKAFNRMIENKDRFIEDYDSLIVVLTDTAVLDKEATGLLEECAVVIKLIRKCVDENER